MKEVGELKGLKLCHLNIRSLLPKWEEVKFILLDGAFEMVGLTETWLHEYIDDNLVTVPGFSLVRQDRKSGKRGGGIGLYIRDDLKFQKVDKCLNDDTTEVISIILNRNNQKYIMIVLVYRPPGGNPAMFIEVLRDYLNEVYNEKYHDLLILGDFNIDYNKKDNKHTKELLNMERDFSLEQTVTGNTRCHVYSESMIDLIFTNVRFAKKLPPVNLNLSDHLLTIFICKKTREAKRPILLTCRSYKDDNMEAYKRDLLNIDWSFVYKSDNPNSIWGKIYKIVISLLEKNCPLKTFRVTKDRPLYIDDHIISLGHIRDKLFKVARRSGLTQDWIIAKRQREIVNYAVRRAKSNYFRTKLEECKGDSKKFWKYVKELIPDKKANKIDEIYDTVNCKLINGTDACNYINNYFCKIGSELVAKLPVVPRPFFNTEIIHNRYIWNQEIMEKDVEKEIKGINTNKASGFMEVNSFVMKFVLLLLKKEFTFLLNLCVRYCIFPEHWKVAITVPIPKSGNTDDVNNLRPISLIPITGKIFEKFMNDHLIYHMEGNNLFFNRQGGFRAGRSTIQTAFGLFHHVLTNRNDKKFVATIYLDLAKAFNTVDHILLIEKLKILGFTGDYVKLMTSYLNNRSQRIKLNNIFSNEMLIPDGVPQGSILGPSLFLCYINDLKHIKFHGLLHLYADDSAITIVSDNVDSLMVKIDHDLHEFSKWTEINKLTRKKQKL